MTGAGVEGLTSTAALAGLMEATGQPLVVSMKRSRRLNLFRLGTGRIQHYGQPIFAETPGAFVCRVGPHAVRPRVALALMNQGRLQPFRTGWLIRSRFRLVGTTP